MAQLAAMPAEQVVARLMKGLNDRSWEVRAAAVLSLGRQLKGRRAPRALVEKLTDPHDLVRIETAQALAAIGDRACLKALYGSLGDASPLVRSYAAAAIGAVGDKNDRQRLKEALATEHDDAAKLEYYAALHQLGTRGIVARLLALLRSDDFEVRIAAARTLAASLVTPSNRDTIKRALREALRRENSRNARAHLHDILTSLDQRKVRAVQSV